MHGGGAHGGIGGIAHGDLDRLVVFIKSVVRNGQGDGLGCFSRIEGEGARRQGIVGARTGGGAAGDHVVSCDGFAGSRREGHRQRGRGHRFGSARASRREADHGRIVVILDGVGMRGRSYHSRIPRIGQADLYRLVGFVKGVFSHRKRNGFTGDAGGEGQGPGTQGVVRTGAGSGSARHQIVHRHLLPGHRR